MASGNAGYWQAASETMEEPLYTRWIGDRNLYAEYWLLKHTGGRWSAQKRLRGL